MSELIVADSGVKEVYDTSSLIDLGPFYDRFGVAQMDVLKSTNVDVMAIRANLAVRKWVDLKLPVVASSVAAIAAIVPTVTPVIQATVMSIPVHPLENLALRKAYFS